MVAPRARWLVCWRSILRKPRPRNVNPIAFQSDADITFEKQIRPILKANCFDCHGEGEKLKGDLDLRLRRLMVKGGESGPAIEAGKPEKSLLYQKVVEGEMPKREKKLTAQEIEIIKRWIVGGAKTAHDESIEPGKGIGITAEDRAHWSFQTIAKPVIPKFKAQDRVRTAVDAFLLAELSKRKLSFSPDAGEVALVRRAYFDLMGLPPTPEEAERFLRDKSPQAFEKLVDRLLADSRYGERWARHWLDVAGYADSDGYVDTDTPRNYAYKYRDYVIRSYNADKPFNQFIIEQLAGDELAGASFTDPHPALANPQSQMLRPRAAHGRRRHRG
jgi:hypothetical protein